MQELNNNVCGLQTSYFFKPGSKFKTFSMANMFFANFSKDFDCEPQIMSIPEDAPVDIPRFIWDNNIISITISYSRLDLRISKTIGAEWKAIIKDFTDRINVILKENEIEVQRLGLVIETCFADDIHNYINEFVNIGKFQNSEEINISWLEILDVESIKTNLWLFLSGQKISDTNKIVFDANSHANEVLSEKDLSLEKLINYFIEIIERKMQNVFE